jgi:hypothetical protein
MNEYTTTPRIPSQFYDPPMSKEDQKHLHHLFRRAICGEFFIVVEMP